MYRMYFGAKPDFLVILWSMPPWLGH